MTVRNEAGVYVLSQHDRPVYIGISGRNEGGQGVYKRLRDGHYRRDRDGTFSSRPFLSSAFVDVMAAGPVDLTICYCDHSQACIIESLLIAVYQPPLNGGLKKGNG